MPQNALYDMGNITVELLPTLITVTCNKAYYANPVGSYRVQIYGGSNLTTLVSQKTSSTNKITFTATDGIVKNTKYKIIARAYQNANAGGDYGGSVTGTATTPTVGGGTHPKATKKVTQKFTNPKLVSPSISDNTASGHVGSAINNSLNNKSTTATKTKISNTQVQETPAKEVAEGVQNSSFEFKKGSSVRSVGNSSIQRGTLTLDTKNKKPNEATVATKDTDIDITGSYYAFGAGIFFGSDLDGVKSSGGLGVFTDASGMNGYFIKLESTDVVGGDKKQLRLLKANSGNLRRIDTEVGTKELALVYGATLYRLDVFIKVGTTSNEVFISVKCIGWSLCRGIRRCRCRRFRRSHRWCLGRCLSRRLSWGVGRRLGRSGSWRLGRCLRWGLGWGNSRRLCRGLRRSSGRRNRWCLCGCNSWRIRW